jgi:hypothetical protein
LNRHLLLSRESARNSSDAEEGDENACDLIEVPLLLLLLLLAQAQRRRTHHTYPVVAWKEGRGALVREGEGAESWGCGA